MSRPDLFLAYRFLTNEESVCPYKSTGLQVRGRVTYSVGPLVTPAYVEEWKDCAKRSFMLGLLVDAATGQQVDVEYLDTAGQWFPLDREESPGGLHDIVGQLNKDPGVPAGKRWIGFAQPAGPAWALDASHLADGVVGFDVRVGIYPTAGPEFITFVGRHLRDPDAGNFKNGKFEDGHMPSSWYVPQLPRASPDGKMYVYGPRGRRWL
jgi:hypothetical protein